MYLDLKLPKTSSKASNNYKKISTIIVLLLVTFLSLKTITTVKSIKNDEDLIPRTPINSLLDPNQTPTPQTSPNPVQTPISTSTPHPTKKTNPSLSPTKSPSPSKYTDPTPTNPAVSPEPTQTPKPTPTNEPTLTNTPTTTPTPNPPQFIITYPEENQIITLSSNQSFCTTDVPAGGNQSGIQRRHTFNNSSWSTYQSPTTFCPTPIEGPNTLQFQYKNSANDESQVYTRNFIIIKTK